MFIQPDIDGGLVKDMLHVLLAIIFVTGKSIPFSWTLENKGTERGGKAK